jgi:hypothetical protein
MKKITTQEATELSTIIPKNYPILEIFHLADRYNALSTLLENVTNEYHYNLELYLTASYFEEEFKNYPSSQLQKFDFSKHRYNKHAKQYDFLFIMIDIEQIEEKTNFYKKLHAIIKNGGKVIFIVEKDVNLRKLEDRLIQENYVAVNPIENTFQAYQILSAQKMHGWGN